MLARFSFVVVLSCLLFAALSEAAPEAVILVAPNGALYQLVEGIPPQWEKVDDKVVDQPEFNRPDRQYRTVGAETRINDAGVVEAFEGVAWRDIGLKSPPAGVQHRKAYLDQMGNAYIDLGGTGKGFTFVGPGAKPVVFPRAQQWDGGGAAPDLQKMVGNPFGMGLLGLLPDGSLVRIDPPTRLSRNFHMERLTPAGAVKDILPMDSVVVVQLSDGTVGILTAADDFKTDFEKAAFPDGIKGGDAFRLYSSHEGNAKQLINAAQAVALMKSGKKPAAVDPKSIQLKPGEKIEKRNGKWMRIGADGKEIPPPAGSLDVLNGNRAAEMFLAGISRNLTDEVAYDAYLGKRPIYFGRDKESDAVLEKLIRVKGCNPVLTGEAGVGKTAIAELLAQRTFFGEIPEARRFEFDVAGAVWVETSADLISLLARSNDPNSQAAAVRGFIHSLKQSQEALGRPIVLFIDEAHMLTPAQFNALKPVLDTKNSPVRIVMSTTNREYGLMVQRDAATERRMPRVNVDEFTTEQTRRLLKEAVIPMLVEAYQGFEGTVSITDSAVEQVLRRSREYSPNSAFPEGPIKLLMDVVTREHRMAGKKSPSVDGNQVGRYVKNELNLKFDPADPNFDSELDKVKQELYARVVDQERLVDRIVDTFRDVIDGDGEKNHRLILVAGPTGAGKTFGAEEAAKALVGENRLLVIDCTKYANANGNINIIMNDLLGAPPGIISSDQTRGILPEFFSGRGRGLNFIVWNEVDKMDPEAFKRLMEMFDKGVLEATDGKSYRVGRSVNILTTNKGSDLIYPRGRARALTRAELEARATGLTDEEIKRAFLRPDANNLYDRSKTLPPEVVQRIHSAIAVLPPTEVGAEKILRNEVNLKADAVFKSKRYKLEVDDAVLKSIVKGRYQPEDGVREPIRTLMASIDEARALLRRKSGIIAENDTVHLGLIPGDRATPDKYKVWKASAPKQVFELAAPDLRSVSDPLRDPKRRALLQSLEVEIAKHVFGQSDMVGQTAEIIRNQWANPMIEQPVSILLLGSTGTGKTELGKAIARVLFGSEERAELIPMGDITHDFDFSNIFNPPKGVEGSGQMSNFEKFLQANKGVGGVFIFDEIGNMGGGDPRRKGELLKRFYKIIDEGTWTNPVTGETYDLRKFIFIMTSNEGQERFNGLPSDDLRQAVWKDLRHKEKLVEMLRDQHGWPEALVARLDNVLLAKPLMLDIRRKVAQKFLDGISKNLHQLAGIGKIEGDEEFYKNFPETFFSHQEGARMMRRIIEKGPVASLVTQARFDLDPAEIEGSTLVFTLEDNYAGRFMYHGAIPPERVVRMTMKVMRDETEIKRFTSDNLADRSAMKRLASLNDIKATSYHEAGHAVANDPALTGDAVDFVTVRGAGYYGGYARYERVGSKGTLTRFEAVAQLGRLLAGMEAQRMMGLPVDSGWSADIEMARKLAEDLVGKYGLTDNALRLPVKDGKVIIENPKVQKEIEALLADGTRYAQKRLRDRWFFFRAVAAKLLRDGHIDRKDFAALEKKTSSPMFLARAKAREDLAKRLGRTRGTCPMALAEKAAEDKDE